MLDESLVTLGPRTRAAPVGRLPAYALRISLLEQCNLACRYCLPGEVNAYTDTGSWMTAAEHARLAPLFARRGIQKVRFTGGEPLLRRDVTDVVRAWSAALPGAAFAMTTNGLHLGPQVDALVDAGLTRLNVHLDSLRDERLTTLMGKAASVGTVIDACARALSAGLSLKLNVVAQRGQNEDEFDAFLALSRRTGIEVRFIELMDTGSAAERVAQTFMSGADVIDTIRKTRPVTALPRRHKSDPASLFRCDDDGTVFGLIASDTRPFCQHCDRLRLSAEGRLRGCLYAPGGAPLGALVRQGASDEQLLDAVDEGLDAKRSWHPNEVISRPAFSMADVGG